MLFLFPLAAVINSSDWLELKEILKQMELLPHLPSLATDLRKKRSQEPPFATNPQAKGPPKVM